jgi:LysR family transcriptional regulator, regulator for bpeEF and oprC
MKGGAVDPFSGVLPFVTAAEAKSFRSAARKLGLTPSAISKAITRLETRLGARLLQRGPRSVSLTDEGATFLRGCQEALVSVQAAEAQVVQAERAPRGRLRLSLPLLLGKLLILPALKRLCDRYPALSVHASLTDRVLSLADENVDAAVRIGTLADSRLSARKLSEVRWLTVAAPSYLARRGTPRTPDELGAHNCLKFVLPNGTAQEWLFEARGSEAKVVATHGSLTCDHGEGLIEATCAGIGIFQAHDYSVAPLLAAGRLIEVLADYSTPGPPIWLVVAPGARRSAKIRAFAEFMLDTMSARR